MNTLSRSENSRKNLIYGIASQVIILLLQFVSRTIFIYFLGSEYLGVNGLYGNILNVLSLAELGIDNVMLFSFYKSISNEDKEQIAGLLYYYKKIYRIITLAVFAIGMAVVPFLKFIVNSDLPHSKVVLYYLLFLVNSVSSYFVVYKTTLIKADQNAFVISKNTSLFTIIRHIAQALFLVITRNYTVYLVIQVCCTMASNLMLSRKADKMYPFIKSKTAVKQTEHQEIWKNIRYAFLYKISNILIGNTDNILISVLVGTVYVGYYSNYSMFIFNISVFLNMLITSVFSSFGNLYAKGDLGKSYKLFNASILFFQWLATACSLCFYTVFNDFITIWIGEKFTFGALTVFIIVLNFYNETVLNPLWLYREIMGLFKEIRYIRIFTAVINLFLSVILGKFFGIFGILVSTFIAKSLTYAWFEPLVILRKLGKPVKKYWFSQAAYVLLAALSFFVTTFVCGYLGHDIGSIVCKIVISVSVSSLIFVVSCWKCESCNTIKYYARSMLQKGR